MDLTWSTIAEIASHPGQSAKDWITEIASQKQISRVLCTHTYFWILLCKRLVIVISKQQIVSKSCNNTPGSSRFLNVECKILPKEIFMQLLCFSKKKVFSPWRSHDGAHAKVTCKGIKQRCISKSRLMNIMYCNLLKLSDLDDLCKYNAMVMP